MMSSDDTGVTPSRIQQILSLRVAHRRPQRPAYLDGLRRMMAERRRTTFSLRTVVARTVVLLVAFSIVVSSAATARSQEVDATGGLPDGAYKGGIYFKMDGSLNLGGFVDMANSFDAAGDAVLIIDLKTSSLTGDWQFTGSGTMGGSAVVEGRAATIAGSSTITARGGFSGTPLDGRLQGTSSTSGTWTITTSEGTTPPIPLGGPGTFDEPLTNLLSECSQLLGKWDSEFASRIEAEYAAQGASLIVTTLVAYFVLSDAGLLAEESWMADRLRDLAKRANSTLAEARGGGEAFMAIADGIALLRDVEQLNAEIAELEFDCPADKAFQNILTLIAQDGLDAALRGLELDPTVEIGADTLRYMVRLGEGTAATGSGAQDTERAADLDSRMEAQANEAFNDALESYRNENGGAAALNEAASLAALGEQQGWNLEDTYGVRRTGGNKQMTMPMRNHRIRALAVGILLVAAACSTGDRNTASVPSTTAVTATTSFTTVQQTTTTTSVAPQNGPLLVGADLVIQLTPTQGVGVRPILDWEAVEGAGSYFLVVKDDAGTPYWAWEGSETAVPLGGAAFPQDYGNGPTIGPGYTWSVSAYAADGTFLAISGDRPVSP